MSMKKELTCRNCSWRSGLKCKLFRKKLPYGINYRCSAHGKAFLQGHFNKEKRLMQMAYEQDTQNVMHITECAYCGREIYPSDPVYVIEGDPIHEDCFHEWAKDRYEHDFIPNYGESDAGD